MNHQTRTALIEATSLLLNYLAVTDEPKPAAIIWGLGSNDAQVARKAAELYHQGMAPWIVFSGGNGHRWQELTQTEAELFRDVAFDCGVPPSHIITETTSTNTGENVLFSLQILDQMNIEVRSAILITIPPFQLRAAATVRKHRPSVECINAPISWDTPLEWDDAKLLQTAKLCVGEVRRLQDYPALGFIDFDPEKIPSGVKRAHENVKAALRLFLEQ